MSRPVITLTTDFGQTDSYVGTMKGVILDICPEATLVDISHDIRPQAVAQAAFVLSTATPYFPFGTIHLVVVDPGVGTTRRAIAVQSKRTTYVAPDNGVLDLALAQDPALYAIHLTEQRYRLPQASATFHGRDIFAPAAAYLAQGTDVRDMGDPISLPDLVTLPASQAVKQPDGAWLGEVIHIDRFGNLITNVKLATSNGPSSILVGESKISRPKQTYADVEPGELVAYVGSNDTLEIAVRDGNAAEQLGVGIGEPIIYKRETHQTGE
jgi:S-adenosylmethionine hydrolase